MIKHHPTLNQLTEYCAGTLAVAPSIAIAAHLHYCPECAAQVKAMNNLGGAMLAAQTPKEPVSEGALDAVFARIDKGDTEQPAPESASQPLPEVSDRLAREVPPVVAKLIRKPSQLNWKRLSPSVHTAKLKTGQLEYEASLIKIRAGGRTLEHDHRGNEFTVVIKGAFSDHHSRSEQGDFVHCKPGDVHTPAATADADCLCLALVDAPLKFTGWMGSVINPFMRISAQ